VYACVCYECAFGRREELKEGRRNGRREEWKEGRRNGRRDECGKSHSMHTQYHISKSVMK